MAVGLLNLKGRTKMKTKVLFSVAAVTALSIVSCQKENSGITPESTPEIEVVKDVDPNPDFIPTQAFSFIGLTDNDFDPETKTSLDGAQVKWAVSDGIYLFDGTAPRAFVSDNESVSATANFDGSAVVADKYYAIYPSGKISTVESKKVIATTIPTFQTATANSFAPKANVAVAYSESDPTGDAALQFKNIAAVVKFKINAENTDVRKVRLDAINGEDMSGAMNVTFNADGTFSTASVHANSESCVILESNSDLYPAQTYYMAIKPGTYAGGFKITLIRADGSFCSINNPTSNTLVRNDLVNFGELPKIPSWKTAGFVDEMTRATTTITDGSTTYSDWSGISVSSPAVYAGNSAGGNNAIQLRASSNSGIITTTSGGKATKVSVSWNSNTADARTLDIYGKNTAYSSVSDLYNTGTRGTKIGSIVYGTSTELDIDTDYEYIGIRSNSGALYLDELEITWGDPSVSAPSDPVKITPSTAISNLSSSIVPLEDGSATFDVVSNVPWTIASNQDYATVSVNESDQVTVTFQNLGSGSRPATITITPAFGAPVGQDFTQSGLPDAETITFADLGLTNSVQYSEPFDGGNFTITFAGGGNDGKYYTTGSGIRTYNEGTITIASGIDMKKIEFTWSGSYKPGSNVANVGTYDPEKTTWTGSAKSVVLTAGEQWRLQVVKVYYK